MYPQPLKPGDKVRFVSPASPPQKTEVLRRKSVLEQWGLRVDFGEHCFDQVSYLAGTDAARLHDLNTAFRDPAVRAIFATRGGKGSYRIADQLDFRSATKDPKFLVGFSDITALHLSLAKNCGLVGIHGALMADETGHISLDSAGSLKGALMTRDDLMVHARRDEPSSAVTKGGEARGRLIGGNLSIVTTAVGWALPDLRGSIVFLEAVDMALGQVDRELTMLRKSGVLDGIAGVAVGQFIGFKDGQGLSIIDLLREHLGQLAVPILGGLPLGHGRSPHCVYSGANAHLNASIGILTVSGRTNQL